ncbi:MAG: ADP-glyceromanno-heptose 6-epimerase [bacterium]|nr:ADP-glyceromanno-heptose 6-epimerase [bacterium]
MKNIVVTGGAGFVGSNLALYLQEHFQGSHIIVVDDFRKSGFKNLEGFKGDVIASNVADGEWIQTVKTKKIDAVFHIASITDTTVMDEKKMMRDNVDGFRNILDFAVEKSAPVVYASSAAVYGSFNRKMREEDGGKPNNIYGFSKWVMENLAETYYSKLKIVGLRYFNVFGPGEYHKGLAASMIYQLAIQMIKGNRPRMFKWGEQRRDFVYIKDVVSATVGALSAKENAVINVGTGKSTSFNEIVEILNKILNSGRKPVYFDNPYGFYQNFTEADISKAKDIIGYEPKYTTALAIEEYITKYLFSRDAESRAV